MSKYIEDRINFVNDYLTDLCEDFNVELDVPVYVMDTSNGALAYVGVNLYTKEDLVKIDDEEVRKSVSHIKRAIEQPTRFVLSYKLLFLPLFELRQILNHEFVHYFLAKVSYETLTDKLDYGCHGKNFRQLCDELGCVFKYASVEDSEYYVEEHFDRAGYLSEIYGSRYNIEFIEKHDDFYGSAGNKTFNIRTKKFKEILNRFDTVFNVFDELTQVENYYIIIEKNEDKRWLNEIC